MKKPTLEFPLLRTFTLTMSKPETKPHRRLSLTLPTVPASSDDKAAPPDSTPTLLTGVAPTQDSATQNTTIETETAAEENPIPASEAGTELDTVRVMAYLTSQEANLLDELWFELRRNSGSPRASKSDILRAALSVAVSHKAELANVIANQQINTSSRQRGRKTAKQ